MQRKVAMISSTAHDLTRHRDQVRKACERAGFEPRIMMENIPALDTDAGSMSAASRPKRSRMVSLARLRSGSDSVPAGSEAHPPIQKKSKRKPILGFMVLNPGANAFRPERGRCSPSLASRSRHFAKIEES